MATKPTKNTQKNKKRSTSAKQAARSRAVKKQEYILKREVILIVTLAVCILLFLCNFNLIGSLGSRISFAMFGLFGSMAYVAPVFLFIFAGLRIANPGNKLATRKILSGIFLFLDLSILFELIHGFYKTLEKYSCIDFFKNSSNNKNGGGIFGGSACYGLYSLIGFWGTLIIFIFVLIISLIFLTGRLFISEFKNKTEQIIEQKNYNRQINMQFRQELDDEYRQKKEEHDRNQELKREEKKQQYLEKQKLQAAQLTVSSDLISETSENISKRELQKQAKEDKRILRKDKKFSGVTYDTRIVKGTSESAKDDIHEINVNNFNPANYCQQNEDAQPSINIDNSLQGIANRSYESPSNNDFTEINSTSSDDFQAVTSKIPAQTPKHAVDNTVSKSVETDRKSASQNYSYISNESYKPEIKKPENENCEKSVVEQIVAGTGANISYKFPPTTLLTKNTQLSDINNDTSIKNTGLKLIETLETFGVKARILEISQGPTVTRYELQPELGVKVSRIKNLAEDIKLSLAAQEIRIEAPVPGKSAVGIEIPNKEIQKVLLRELIESDNFKNSSSKLSFALGKDISGQTVIYDIDKFPHLLIAGTTGSGKSVCINTLIMSIIYKASPDDVKLIMIDPKVVELSVYNGIPHLMIPVVTEAKKASAALNWAVTEMMERFRKFEDLKVRDINGYNEVIEKNPEYKDSEIYKKIPRLVLIIDELADLMMVAKSEVEESICRLTQLARAAGIHLIVATQRPSVDVVTGLIKANTPSRIAFAVANNIDSRTILDMSGAEELLGNGDMLFFPKGYKKPVRLQGGYVSDSEINNVVTFIKQYSTVDYDDTVINHIDNNASSDSSVQNTSDNSEFDEYFMDAAKIIIEKNKASIGMLQRYFKIGFNRAARIMDKLAEIGVVSDEEGTKARRVLMNMEEFENYIEENGL